MGLIKKLELGILEFLVGALMAVGLVGYFGSIPADLDWIDHTVSFVLFSYLFYRMDITSILFGKTSRPANLIIIISYFSLFFKDIISYTALDAFKFRLIDFVDYFYIFFRDNISMATLASFYIGIAGLFIAGIYAAIKIEVSPPSFLYAVYPKRFKSNSAKFLPIIILLLGFYYFVYSIALEWLEFTIDDPVVAAGAIFFVYKIAKHAEKFRADNFIFRIGSFSTKWYTKFVSLFHSKKTLPLAISGLLALHALSDLGVFAYSLVFFKENFYLEFLEHDHVPFLKLFLGDAAKLPSFALIPLLIDYLLNALSLIIFLLIPVVAWVMMISKKELHFSRALLFFIYSSIAAYMLMPGYILSPLEGLPAAGKDTVIRGVDISSISLLENKSVLGNIFPSKSDSIVAASLVSVMFGLAVYLLSSNPKIKKEMYALSVIGGMAFYSVYIYYSFISISSYLYDTILLVIFTPHFLVGVSLAVFLALSISFYIGGYFMFLYEIVMEYLKRKMKSLKKPIMAKKSQFIGEVFKYLLVGAVSIAILVAGYKLLLAVKERGCQAEIAKFEVGLRDIGRSLRFGEKELKVYDAPCSADQIYFFGNGRVIEPEIFKGIPIMKDAIKSGSQNNVFLVNGDKVKRAFYAGSMEMAYPYYICFVPKSGKISFFAEGAGKSARMAAACNQPECTFIPIEISEEDSRKIIKEAADFGCRNCPGNPDEETARARLTRQNVEMLRKITSCKGITEVQVVIRPKKGAEAEDFTFYEFIPKNCISDLNKYLAETIDGNVEIKSDPLIMWHFDVLAKEQKVSYKLSAEFSDECRQAIQGLGVAQFIRGTQAGEEQQLAGNAAPPASEAPYAHVPGTGTNCEDGEEGECKERCAQNAEKKCEDKDKIYWFDSCGKKGPLYFDCRDNLIRNQCRNSECCVGNFFCEAP